MLYSVVWIEHNVTWMSDIHENKNLKPCNIGKDSDPGRDWGQEEKGTTEDDIINGWHH